MSDEPEETSYYLRLLSMYMDLGTKTVLDVFTYYSPNKEPETFIKENEDILLQLKNRRILNKQELKLLFTDETNGNGPNVKNAIELQAFDISLLISLSINLFNEKQLQPPKKGWQNPPRNNDTSIAADLLRLRTKRNVIIGHHSKARMPRSRFEQEWEDISEILVRVQSQISSNSEEKMKESIKAYRVQKLGATVQSKYDAKLKEWLENIRKIQTSVKNIFYASDVI